MSVILYKDGGTQKVEPEFMENELAAGWSLTPVEHVAPPEDSDVFEGVADEDIRALAKDAKIKNWYNKGIDRLKEELADAI